MNPLRWVRWKLLAVLAIVGGGLYFLGINPLALWQINSAGSASPGARWSVGGIGLGLLSGDFRLDDIWVDSARGKSAAEAAAKAFAALRTNLDVSTTDLLSRRLVVDEIRLDGPRMRIVRRPDGSTNLGEIGEPPPDGPPPPAGKSAEDWVETAKKWYERLETLREKLGKRGPKQRDEAKEAEARRRKDYYARASTYPFEGRPNVLVRKVVASGLEVSFDDESAAPGAALPKLAEATLELTGVSSAPALGTEPMVLSLRGTISPAAAIAAGMPAAAGIPGAAMALKVALDFRGDVPKYDVDLDTGMLPAEIVSSFISKSLPVDLRKGLIGISAKVGLGASGELLVEPKLRFQGVELGEKAGASRVAGLSAAEFVSAFNEASRALGDTTLEISDLRISGTLEAPRFEWGNTVKNLVLQGGKAFAQKHLQDVQNLAGKEIGKISDKISAEAAKALGTSEAGKKVKEGVERVIPGGADAIKDKAKDAIDLLPKGLFPRGEKKKEN